MITGWESEEGLRRLARALPHPVPEPARVASVRARVLARAGAERRRARLRSGAFVAFALAALAVLAIGLRQPSGRDPVPRYHGTITADSRARFRRVSAAPDELVVLDSGKIHVEVSPLGPGERFRVQAGDGEVEVRGTAFDVTVEGGHLASVEVEHGRVDVRSAGSASARLGPGQHWVAAPAEPPAIDVPSSAAPAVEAPSASATRRTPPSSLRSSKSETAAVEIPSSIPPPLPSVAPPPLPSVVAPPLRPAPTATANPSDDAPAPASTHDEDRRERRDERRERHDQRRLR